MSTKVCLQEVFLLSFISLVRPTWCDSKIQVILESIRGKCTMEDYGIVKTRAF